MIFSIILLIVILIILQLIIGHFWHDVGFNYSKSIQLMFLPLGIGLFIMQIASMKDIIQIGMFLSKLSLDSNICILLLSLNM